MKFPPRFGQALLLLILVAFARSAFSQAGPVMFGGNSFDSAEVPIFQSRIFRVPDEGQAHALGLLGKKDFVPLSGTSLKALLPQAKLDMQQMLSAQASAADAYAKRRETEAAMPFFVSSRGWMLKDATAHRDLARYTRALSPELHPYLVKAQAYFDGTGGFTVTLHGNRLSVLHGSLGHSTPPKHDVAVAIFLEREIVAVDVSAAIAE